MSEEQASRQADDVRSTIRNFILAQFPLARSNPPSDTDDLLESGIVDSLGILEIVNFLVSEFGVEVTDDDLDPENFGSIGHLAQFVDSKRD